MKADGIRLYRVNLSKNNFVASQLNIPYLKRISITYHKNEFSDGESLLKSRVSK